MTDLPICLVIGIDGQNPEIIIKGIIEDGSPATQDESGLCFYKWTINNKYYDASINFCSMTTKIVVNETFAENVNAAIIYFSNLEGLKKADDWLPFLNEFECGVKILVCEQCSIEGNSTYIPKITAQQWCIRHGFELVELDPLEKPDPDDDFPETLGIERIIQALHAHSWPNLTLKSGDKNRIDQLSRMLLSESVDESLNDCSAVETNSAIVETSDGLVSGTDRQMSEGIDSFEELFQAMSLMKSQASALQGAERKAYAEKMTMAFWQAIDGNPDEIEGLDSSLEED